MSNNPPSVTDQLTALVETLHTVSTAERIVIHLAHKDITSVPTDISAWAEDSVSSWTSLHDTTHRVDRMKYLLLPKVIDETMLSLPAISALNICNSFLGHIGTNRTCFDKC